MCCCQQKVAARVHTTTTFSFSCSNVLEASRRFTTAAVTLSIVLANNPAVLPSFSFRQKQRSRNCSTGFLVTYFDRLKAKSHHQDSGIFVLGLDNLWREGLREIQECYEATKTFPPSLFASDSGTKLPIDVTQLPCFVQTSSVFDSPK